jgi:hypothetical protein
MSGRVCGRVSWLGYDLPLAVPDARWFAWVENFTGLAVERLETGSLPTVLSVLDDRHVLVDETSLRRFPSPEDLKAWLFLTVSDVMIMRGGFTAFHAAALAVTDGCLLVSGLPWSGKSSWAFAALRRGLEVLGDDQVQVDPTAGTVRPLPRPLKYRLRGEEHDARLSADVIRAQLDGERIALAPRRTAGLAPVERAYRVVRIVHLARHAGTGVRVRILPKSEAFRAVLDQIRGYPPSFVLADAAAVARMLGPLQNIHISVGDGELERALDLALTFN